MSDTNSRDIVEVLMNACCDFLMKGTGCLDPRELQAAASEILALREKGRWIPVTKRLPEHHQLVLVFDPECFGFGLAALTKDQGWRGEEVNMYAPTHWMPLPAPPEEEKP